MCAIFINHYKQLWSFIVYKNLHIDIEWDIHMNSKHYEENGYGHHLDLAIILHWLRVSHPLSMCVPLRPLTFWEFTGSALEQIWVSLASLAHELLGTLSVKVCMHKWMNLTILEFKHCHLWVPFLWFIGRKTTLWRVTKNIHEENKMCVIEFYLASYTKAHKNFNKDWCIHQSIKQSVTCASPWMSNNN